MTQEEARKQIDKLVKKYESLTPAQKKKYNESMTCKDFILPLFLALGWDVYNNDSLNEVTSETQVSGKRADYAFHVHDVIKFFVEAKKIDVDLREEKLAEQAVFYAWHKSVPWAILTDFESIKVFNAEWDEPNVEQSLLFEIPYTDYLTDKRLWWLSKQSMLKGELDKYAEENFKKPKREPVDKQLANDLVRWRTTLFNELKQYNSKKLLTDRQVAKGVQQLLNRLIFIRTTEDRKIEGEKLRELVRNWEEDKNEVELEQELKKLFKYYDKEYDSKLFEPSICDALIYEDNLLALVIEQLYRNKSGIRYDFASINADVLGNIYEQYLGQIQQDEQEHKKGKRKSQGIYYTPRYIVDYIVKNTLGVLLKDKSGYEASKIKVLDPACGSGSFLIKAFEVLDHHIKIENNQLNAPKLTHYARKVGILTSNIYGVDLDEEAVEIAQLNLLLKVLEYREKLPNLAHNIECGNSLISGGEKELKKYFGENWKEQKPFNWDHKFKEVFDKRGFNVVIGNPPYIDSEEIVKKDKNFRLYCSDIYESAKGNWDIFCIFIQKGLDLLNEGGYFGMIIPNKLLSADYANSIREIIKNYIIISINDYSNVKVFGASVYPVVIIIKKEKPDKNHKILVNSYTGNEGNVQLTNSEKINQTVLEKYNKSWSPIFDYKSKANFVDRIIENEEKLINFCNIHGAATVDEAYKIKEIMENLKNGVDQNNYFRFINTGTIDRYISLRESKKTQYIKSAYIKPVVSRDKLKKMLPTRFDQSNKNKIVIGGMTKELECFLDENGEYLAGKSTTIVESEKLDLKFVLALLNSKLLTFIYKNIFSSLSLQGGYLRIGAPQIKELPIKISPLNKVETISELANRIIKLKKELQKLDPILDKEECMEKKKEIEEIDKEIDQLVYKLYSLTPEEIEVVERNK